MYLDLVRRHLLPLYNRQAGLSWVRIGINERDPNDVLFVLQLASRQDMESARLQLPPDLLEALDAAVEEPGSGGRRTYTPVRTRERFDTRSTVIVAMLSEVEPSDAEAFLGFQSVLQDRLVALPGTMASFLLVDEARPHSFLHVLEFVDRAAAEASRDERERDDPFLERAARTRFVGELAHTWDRWRDTTPGRPPSR